MSKDFSSIFLMFFFLGLNFPVSPFLIGQDDLIRRCETFSESHISSLDFKIFGSPLSRKQSFKVGTSSFRETFWAGQLASSSAPIFVGSVSTVSTMTNAVSTLISINIL